MSQQTLSEFVYWAYLDVVTGKCSMLEANTTEGNVKIYKCGSIVRVDVKPRDNEDVS